MTVKPVWKITASGSALNDLALSLFRAAELARAINAIYEERFRSESMSIYNELETNGYYNIRED